MDKKTINKLIELCAKRSDRYGDIHFDPPTDMTQKEKEVIEELYDHFTFFRYWLKDMLDADEFRE